MAFPIPHVEISRIILTRIAKTLARTFLIEVELNESASNPSVVVVYDTAIVKYQLIIRTHGIPKYHPPVRFIKVKSLGEIKKKAISPSGLGEIDESMRLKLYNNEMRSNTDSILNVNFEVRIDPSSLVTLTFPRESNLTANSPEIEVVATSNCSFPLEQISLEIKKSSSFQIKDVKIAILDKTSHNTKEDVNSRCITKGDECVRWITSFPPGESLLFKITGIP